MTNAADIHPFVTRQTYLPMGRRVEDLNDHDLAVVRARGLKVHKPRAWDFEGRDDVTECGRKLSRVIYTEDGIERTTCSACVRIYDGI